MNSISNLSIKTLLRAATIKGKIQSLEKQLIKLLGSNGVTAKYAPGKAKGKKSAVKPVKKGRRKMSAAAKAKISASAKARWKRAKAAGKTRL